MWRYIHLWKLLIMQSVNLTRKPAGEFRTMLCNLLQSVPQFYCTRFKCKHSSLSTRQVVGQEICTCLETICGLVLGCAATIYRMVSSTTQGHKIFSTFLDEYIYPLHLHWISLIIFQRAALSCLNKQANRLENWAPQSAVRPRNCSQFLKNTRKMTQANKKHEQ